MAVNLIELCRLLGYYGELLTVRQRELLEQYTAEDCSLTEIAEREGISRQGVRDVLKRAEEQLINAENKLNFLQRDKIILAELASIISSLNESNVSDAKARLTHITEIIEGCNGV